MTVVEPKSTWERIDGKNAIAMVRVIDHTDDTEGVRWVRVSAIGSLNHRWWMPEATLCQRYRLVVGSEAEAAAAC